MDSNWKRQENISRQAGNKKTQKFSVKQGKDPGNARLARFSFMSSFRFWLGSRQEWGSAILVFVTLAIAMYSVDQAKWITPQPPLTLVLGIAVLTSLVLVRGRLPDAATFSLITILGAVITVWQSASLLVSPEATVKPGLTVALYSWWKAISTSQPNESTVHFTTFLLFFTWILGFISIWFILRKQNAWVAVSLGTITIAINLSNLPKEHYYFLPIYLLAAMLLIGQTNLTKQSSWFKKHGSSYPTRAVIYFITSVICISVLVISSAWFIPETQFNQPMSTVSTGIPQLKDARARWFNIFAAVPSKWRILRSIEQERLSFRDPLTLSDEIQFVITPQQSYHYWRTRRYDTYHSWGWTSNPDSDYMLNPGTPANEGKTFPSHQEINYTVENKVKTDVLLTAGEFISTNIPVVVKTLSEKGIEESFLPTDEAFVAPPGRVSPIMTMSFGLDAMGRLLPRDKMLTRVVNNHNQARETGSGLIAPASQPAADKVNFVASSEVEDIISVIAPQLLKPYQRYTVAASINSATPVELSLAGEDYAEWVTTHYLQLPYSLPTLVRQLSQKVVSGAETPYDKVGAVKRFLRNFKYNEAAKASPRGADSAYYFLFVQREGNCLHFASAMVILLRAADVPARLSTGYLHQDEVDKNTGKIVIRAQDYHAWPEVYFPGYGWVEFEATPVSVNNEEDILETGGAGADNYDWFDEEEELGGFGTATPTTTSTIKSRRNIPFATSFSLLLAFALGLFLYRWLQRFKRAETASEVYYKMYRLASLAKSGPNAYETPLEYCTRLAYTIPPQAEAIGNIAQAYIKYQFSQRKTLEVMQKITLRQSWHAVYPALLKRMLRLKR